MYRRLSSRAKDILRGVVFVLIVAAPFFQGGASVDVNVYLVPVWLAVLLACVWIPIKQSSELAIARPAIVLTFALLVALLQLVPLPFGLVEKLSPGAAPIYDLFTPHPDWIQSSMDAPATAHEVIKLVGCVTAGALGSILFRRSSARLRLQEVVVFAAGVSIVVGVVQQIALSDGDILDFGFSAAGMSSTFLNSNQFAGFVGFGGILALGLALFQDWRARTLGIIVSILSLGVLPITGSRGAMFACAAVMLMMLTLSLRFGKRKKTTMLVMGSVVTFCAAAVLFGQRVQNAVESLQTERGWAKLELWESVPAIARDYWGLGVGRGAYFAISPRYVAGANHATSIENELLQTVVDFGIVPGLLILLLLGIAIWPLFRAALRQEESLAPAAGILFLIVHNLVDFNLSVTAIALPACLILGAWTSGELAPTWRVSKVQSMFASACLIAVLAVCAPYAVLNQMARVRAQIQAAISTPDIRDEALNDLLTRHPAYYAVPRMIGEETALQQTPIASLPWFERGIALGPTFAISHLSYARAVVAAGGEELALPFYAAALQTDPAFTGTAVKEAVTLGLDDETALRGLVGTSLVANRAIAAQMRRRQMYNASNDVLRSIPPDKVTAADLTHLAQSYIALQAWPKALEAAEQSIALDPASAEGYTLARKILEKMNEPGRALMMLELGATKVADKEPLILELIDSHLKAKNYTEARVFAEALERAAESRPALAKAHALHASIFESDGSYSEAVMEYQKAQRVEPDRLTHRLGAARAWQASGNTAAALETLQKASQELGPSTQLTNAIARLRKLDNNSNVGTP